MINRMVAHQMSKHQVLRPRWRRSWGVRTPGGAPWLVAAVVLVEAAGCWSSGHDAPKNSQAPPVAEQITFHVGLPARANTLEERMR
jgi:hypothetical protein